MEDPKQLHIPYKGRSILLLYMLIITVGPFLYSVMYYFQYDPKYVKQNFYAEPIAGLIPAIQKMSVDIDREYQKSGNEELLYLKYFMQNIAGSSWILLIFLSPFYLIWLCLLAWWYWRNHPLVFLPNTTHSREEMVSGSLKGTGICMGIACVAFYIPTFITKMLRDGDFFMYALCVWGSVFFLMFGLSMGCGYFLFRNAKVQLND